MAFIPKVVLNTVIDFSPEQKFTWLKEDRRSFFNTYEKITGMFVDEIPVGLFTLEGEDKQIEEEVIFII